MYYSLFVSLQPFTFSIMSWKNCRWNCPCKQNLLMWHLVFFSPMCLFDAVSGVAFNNVTHPPPIHSFLFLFFGDVTALVNFFANVTSPIFLPMCLFSNFRHLWFSRCDCPPHQTSDNWKGGGNRGGADGQTKEDPLTNRFFYYRDLLCCWLLPKIWLFS